MNRVMGAVTAIRTLRSTLNVPHGLKLKATATGPFAQAILSQHRSYVSGLARLENLSMAEGGLPPQNATAVAEGVTFFVPLAGVIDFDKERERLAKDLAKVDDDILKIEAKVKNPDFIARAPQSQIDQAQDQYQTAVDKRTRLKETLSVLS
jgi:valyl-tRNA synthetase